MRTRPEKTHATLALVLAAAPVIFAAAPAPSPPAAAAPAAPAVAPNVPTSGVNGYSSLANLVTLPAATPGGRATPRLGSTAFIWERLEAHANGTTGVRRNVSDLPTATIGALEIHISTLNPGQSSHPPHRHGNEEFIVLKEGALEVGLGGVTADVRRTETVGPGAVFFFAANQYHNVENKGDRPATYLVFNIHTAATPRTPPDGTPSDPVPAGKLNSVIFDWEKSVAKPTPTGSRRDIFNGATTTAKNFECAVITLNAGKSYGTRGVTSTEQLLVVKDGLLDVTVNGKTERGTPGTIFFIASLDTHKVGNATDKSATFYLFDITTELAPKIARDEGRARTVAATSNIERPTFTGLR
jgi:quercetin dioxygenase-like cupin family protein